MRVVLQLRQDLVAVELGHQDVEQQQVERAAAATGRAPRRRARRRRRCGPRCSSPRASRSRFTRLSSAIRIVPGAGAGRAHATGSDRRAASASSSGRYSCSIRSTSSRGAVELAVLGALLEAAAELRELLGAERRAVRLQRVRRPPQLLGVLLVERAAEGLRSAPAHPRGTRRSTSPRNSSPPRSRRFWSAPSSRLTYSTRPVPPSPFRERLRALQRRGELLGADRLRDVVVHAGREARLAILGQRVRRHRDDVRAALLRPALADPARGVEAVELRHLHVHQDDVVRLPLERLDRLEAVRRDVGAVAEPLEQAERDLLVHRVVLGEQDPQRRPGALSVGHGLDRLSLGPARGEQLQERVVELRRLETASRAGPRRRRSDSRLRQAAERGQKQRAGAPARSAGPGSPRARASPSISGIIMSSTATSNGSPGLDQRERLRGQLDRDRLHSPRPRVPGDDLAVRRVVVDDEDPLAGEVREARRRARSSSAPRPRRRAARCGRSNPSPGSLSTEIVPPISSTRRFEIASPSPVPPKRRVVEASTWLNEVNSWSIRSGGIPIPVSRTASSTRYEPGPVSSASTSTTTSPALGELDRVREEVQEHLPQARLVARRSRRARPRRSGSRARCSFSHARGATMSSAPSTQSRRLNGSRSRSSLPASIFE